jgi:hypothetical protein
VKAHVEAHPYTAAPVPAFVHCDFSVTLVPFD